MAAAKPPSGGQRDLVTGPIGKTLLAFALPTLASNILQSLNGSINAIWVGRFLGESALAATSNANTIMFLMFAAVFGFGMAATILIGQSFGRCDIDGARRAFGAACGMILAISVAVAAIGWVFTHEILAAMATPRASMAMAIVYLRIIFLALPAIMLMVLTTMGLRGAGDSMTPLFITGFSALLDAGLNPLLIRGIGPVPAMGIAGSATASLLASYAAFFALVVYVYARDLPIRLRGTQLWYLLPSRALMCAIAGKGIAIGAQMIVIAVAGLTMFGLVNREGVDTSAAFGVTLQLWNYVQMPALAIGAAVSAMAAQNIGAGQWDRIDRTTSAGIALNLVITGAMVVALLLFDEPIMALFLGGNSPALPIALHIQLVATWGFMLFGITMVLFAVVRANGAVLGPLAVLFVAMFPVRLGFATSLRPVLGVDSLWLSFPLGSFTTVVLAAVFYRYGSWRRGAFLAARLTPVRELADGPAT